MITRLFAKIQFIFHALKLEKSNVLVDVICLSKSRSNLVTDNLTSHQARRNICSNSGYSGKYFASHN